MENEKRILSRMQRVARNRIEQNRSLRLEVIDAVPYHEKDEKCLKSAIKIEDLMSRKKTELQEIESEIAKLNIQEDELREKESKLYGEPDIWESLRSQISDTYSRLSPLEHKRADLKKDIYSLQCNLEFLDQARQSIITMVTDIESLDRHSTVPFAYGKEDVLADKAIFCITEYLKDNYDDIDDFIVKFGRFGYIHHDRSFKRFAELTAKGLKAREYRRTFSRIICWVHWDGSMNSLTGRSEYYRVPKGEDRFFYGYRMGTLYPEISVRERWDWKIDTDFLDVHAKTPFLEGVQSPFEHGSKSDRKVLRETFCRILLEMSELSDAVAVAKDYSEFVSPRDIATLIARAINERQRGLGEKLAEMLVSCEPSHPDLARFQNELSRLAKIEVLGTSTNLDLESLNALSGTEFEQLLASKFLELGFRVEETPATGDYGADLIIVTPNDTRVSIQCKRFRNKVNLKAVQEVVGSLSHYQCDFGVVVTNSSFLNSAKKRNCSGQLAKQPLGAVSLQHA